MTSCRGGEGSLAPGPGTGVSGLSAAPSGAAGHRPGGSPRPVDVPMLFLQGTRDEFARLDLITDVCGRLEPRATLHLVDGGDHSFGVPKRSGRTAAEVMDELADSHRRRGLARWSWRRAGMSFEPTAQQRRAIEAPLGPVLVMAGPGAGKTYCLIGRIQHLIEARTSHPAGSCAVTFTNKAAEEIALRLHEARGYAAEDITRGTLHAMCLTVLRDFPSVRTASGLRRGGPGVPAGGC